MWGPVRDPGGGGVEVGPMRPAKELVVQWPADTLVVGFTFAWDLNYWGHDPEAGKKKKKETFFSICEFYIIERKYISDDADDE